MMKEGVQPKWHMSPGRGNKCVFVVMTLPTPSLWWTSAWKCNWEWKSKPAASEGSFQVYRSSLKCRLWEHVCVSLASLIWECGGVFLWVDCSKVIFLKKMFKKRKERYSGEGGEGRGRRKREGKGRKGRNEECSKRFHSRLMSVGIDILF